jgi:hypothetical protein
LVHVHTPTFSHADPLVVSVAVPTPAGFEHELADGDRRATPKLPAAI